MTEIEKKLSSIYSDKDINQIYLSGRKGYWSNLSKAQNEKTTHTSILNTDFI